MAPMSADATGSPSLSRANHLLRTADALARSAAADRRTTRLGAASLPDPVVVVELLDRLVMLLFPGLLGPRDLDEASLGQFMRDELRSVAARLQPQIALALAARMPAASGARTKNDGGPASERGRAVDEATREQAETITLDFLGTLPSLRDLLSRDVQAAYDGDPAAGDTDETVLCYPGVYAISVHRLAHELYRLGVPIVPRIMSEHAHGDTGIDIHPGARIGRSFFIDHGTGVVIGETTVIGDHCKIYQGVTLGARSFPRDELGRLARNIKRHPTLDDHVTVYAGATILGGDTVIGTGCIVGGGVFLTSSVPPGHVVRGPRHEITLKATGEV